MQRNGHVIHTQEKEEAIETASECLQVFDSAAKDVKAVI